MNKNSTLTPYELMEHTALAAAETYLLGATESDSNFKMFTRVIRLTAKAWKLPVINVHMALGMMYKEIIEVDKDIEAIENGLQAKFERNVLLKSKSENEPLPMLIALQATADQLTDEQDKKQIAELIDFCEGFAERHGTEIAAV